MLIWRRKKFFNSSAHIQNPYFSQLVRIFIIHLCAVWFLHLQMKIFYFVAHNFFHIFSLFLHASIPQRKNKIHIFLSQLASIFVLYSKQERYLHCHHTTHVGARLVTVFMSWNMREKDLRYIRCSGSSDPDLWLKDPDPALFVSDLQDANKRRYINIVVYRRNKFWIRIRIQEAQNIRIQNTGYIIWKNPDKPEVYSPQCRTYYRFRFPAMFTIDWFQPICRTGKIARGRRMLVSNLRKVAKVPWQSGVQSNRLHFNQMSTVPTFHPQN